MLFQFGVKFDTSLSVDSDTLVHLDAELQSFVRLICEEQPTKTAELDEPVKMVFARKLDFVNGCMDRGQCAVEIKAKPKLSSLVRPQKMVVLIHRNFLWHILCSQRGGGIGELALALALAFYLF